MAPEAHIGILSTLLLVGGINGLVFAFLLIKLRKRNLAANRYLATLLAANGLLLLNEFFVRSDLVYQYPYLFGLTMAVEVVFAPCLYLYVRNMTQIDASKYKDYLFFIPAVVSAMLILPFYFLDFDAKKAIFDSNYIVWPGVLKTTQPIYMFIAGLQFVVFLVLSFKLLFKHTKKVSQFFSYKENITLLWLRNFLLFNLLLLIFFLAFTAAYFQSYTEIRGMLDWFLGINVLFIFYLGIMGLLQRRIYQHNFVGNNYPTKTVVTTTSTIKEGDSSKVVTAGKYKKSALSKELSLKILDRLQGIMAHDKPYLDNDLTLPQLAKMVATSSNNLSQVINEQLSMNFFDYINSYRIELAKQLIINPLPHTKTILDVAMEAAFNSKSAFYSAFKKQVGITPANFKKQIQINDM